MSGSILYIKKRKFSESLTYFVLILPLLLSSLIDFLNLPSLVKYSIDIAIVLILSSILFGRRVAFKNESLPLILIILSFFALTLIVYLFSYQSLVYYLWGFRNNFRFYIAFLAFILYFTKDDAEFFLNFFDKVFWLNVVVTFVQFTLGYRQDYLGGLFGVIPLTGVPLPFLSYGGSFTISLIASLAVIQRIHIEYKMEKTKINN